MDRAHEIRHLHNNVIELLETFQNKYLQISPD